MGLCSINCSLILKREVRVGGTLSWTVCGISSEGWARWYIDDVLLCERAAAPDFFQCDFS